MSIPDEIQRLAQLRTDGVMTEEEFAEAKRKLLDQYEGQQPAQPLTASLSSSFDSIHEKTWSICIHLGQFLPGVGWAVPLVIWLIKKDQSAMIDEHGKNVLNWMISLLIYFFLCFSLVFVFIGFLLIPVLVVLCIVFPIIGAIKANEGTAWKYPLAITFIR